MSILTLLFSLALFIQPTDTTTTSDILIIHDSLKTSQFKRIHLSNFEGWRYHPGDNLNWANPEYDDSNWTRLSSAQDVPDSLWTGIGWWRIKIKADSSMVDKVLGFNVYGSGAAELYLDGRLILSNGNPSPNPEDQKLILSPNHSGYLAELDANRTYTLALRFSFQNFYWYQTITGGTFASPITFSITAEDAESFNYNYYFVKVRESLGGIASTILFMVMILHLIMYLRFNENSNFWIFLITFCLWVSITVRFLVYLWLFADTEFYLYTYLPSSYLAITAICLIPYVLGKLLNIHIHKFWKYYFIFAPAFNVVLYLFFRDTFTKDLFEPIFYAAFFSISFIAGSTITYKAYKKKKNSLWLIAISILSVPAIPVIGIFLKSARISFA